MDLTLEKFPDFHKKKEKGLEISKWHFPPTHSWRMVESMMHTPSGCTAFDNKIYYPKKLMALKSRDTIIIIEDMIGISLQEQLHKIMV